MKYKKNLHIEGSKVYSYKTHVATIEGRKLIVHGYWSTTTSKHINHVADVYGLEKVKEIGDRAQRLEAEKHEEREGLAHLKTVALVASLGEVFGANQVQRNDWKTRMLKAGLEGRGLIMPEDWDTLSEDEKTRRLNGAISQLV